MLPRTRLTSAAPPSTAQSSDSALCQEPTYVLVIVSEKTGQATMWGRGIGSTHVICKYYPVRILGSRRVWRGNLFRPTVDMDKVPT